jgi:hypothetical protein
VFRNNYIKNAPLSYCRSHTVGNRHCVYNMSYTTFHGSEKGINLITFTIYQKENEGADLQLGGYPDFESLKLTIKREGAMPPAH